MAAYVDSNGNFVFTGDFGTDAAGVPIGGTNLGTDATVTTSPYIPSPSVAASTPQAPVNLSWLPWAVGGVLLFAVVLAGGRRR